MKRSYLVILAIITIIITILTILALNSCSEQNINIENEVQQENNVGGSDVSNISPTDGITIDDLMVDKSDLVPIDDDDSDEEWFHDRFVNERGIEYWFNSETGELFGILAPIPSHMPDNIALSIEEMVQIAERMASQFIDTSKYTLTHHTSGASRFYRFDFDRIINGYITEENVSITLYNSGDVIDVFLRNIDLFDRITVPSIDETEFDQKFEVAVRGWGDYYEGRRLRIEGRYLVVRDGQLYLNYAFVYKIGSYDGENMYGELQGINIPIPGAEIR